MHIISEWQVRLNRVFFKANNLFIDNEKGSLRKVRPREFTMIKHSMHILLCVYFASDHNCILHDVSKVYMCILLYSYLLSHYYYKWQYYVYTAPCTRHDVSNAHRFCNSWGFADSLSFISSLHLLWDISNFLGVSSIKFTQSLYMQASQTAPPSQGWSITIKTCVRPHPRQP